MKMSKSVRSIKLGFKISSHNSLYNLVMGPELRSCHGSGVWSPVSLNWRLGFWPRKNSVELVLARVALRILHIHLRISFYKCSMHNNLCHEATQTYLLRPSLINAHKESPKTHIMVLTTSFAPNKIVRLQNFSWSHSVIFIFQSQYYVFCIKLVVRANTEIV
jgi:hypothetical protein